jgi:geranylgeranyl diphosphate synthase, type I
MAIALGAAERYRTEFEAATRGTLDGCEGQLYDMVRYHLGWQDETGRPTSAQGKILRPILCLLACEACGGDHRAALPGAVAVELTHNFSLVHDDIQDGDEQRHGRPTVWKLWGVGQAINAGDLLWALANNTLAEASDRALSPRAAAASLRALNHAAVRMIEGQHMDISFEERVDVALEEYVAMVERKTGALFGCALELGAIAAGTDESAAMAFRRLGERLGVAFQAHDDVLGIWGDSALTGKSQENDILRRKKSLPVVYALATAQDAERQVLSRAYGAAADGDGPRPDVVRDALEAAGAREFASQLARDRYDQAFAETEALALDADAFGELRAMAKLLLERDS